GNAILPELKTRFDPAGRGGAPRRLRLMHVLDPVATRDVVKQALEAGSKEVKVAAIECLGGSEDLSYLLEHASAKAQEVRQAAYRALATMDDDAALTVLRKALAGKDVAMAADAIRSGGASKAQSLAIAVAEEELATLAKAKDKKDVSARIARLQTLVG